MRTDGTSVVANLNSVRERIAAACRRAGRETSSVALIAVTKTKPLEMIDAAAAAGQRDFGENYVQEAVEKASARPGLAWHFIGGLQTNKVKAVVGPFALIHSVDREKLARALSNAAVAAGVVQDIRIQVNIGDESSKSGIGAADAPAFAKTVASLPGLRLRGLMCLPPLTDDESVARGFFRELRALAAATRMVLPPAPAAAFTELSMGTSHDFEWAIEEGATMIRVGTTIFGERERAAGSPA